MCIRSIEIYINPNSPIEKKFLNNEEVHQSRKFIKVQKICKKNPHLITIQKTVHGSYSTTDLWKKEYKVMHPVSSTLAGNWVLSQKTYKKKNLW